MDKKARLRMRCPPDIGVELKAPKKAGVFKSHPQAGLIMLLNVYTIFCQCFIS